GIGGEANAVTGKEHTCYYARVLDDDLPLAVDVLADMVTSARLDNDDVEHERFAEVVLAGHDLGRPIGGTPDTIRAVGRDAVAEHYSRHYAAPGLVVTAAGGIDHDSVCELVAAQLARAGWPLPAAALPRSRRPANPVAIEPGERRCVAVN